MWDGTAAAFLALWAAYAKRERLKRVWEEERARTVCIVWDAADRAKRHAILNAVARDLAEDGGQDDTANDDTDTEADTPPPPRQPRSRAVGRRSYRLTHQRCCFNWEFWLTTGLIAWFSGPTLVLWWLYGAHRWRPTGLVAQMYRKVFGNCDGF